MIVHIFPNEKFTATNIEILKKSKYGKDCVFFILKSSAPYLKDRELIEDNIFFINSLLDSRVSKYLKTQNRVIFHSLFIKPNDLLYLFLYKKNAVYWNWVIWGGDMHQFFRPMTAKNKIKYLFFKSIVSNFGFITTLSDKDYLIAQDKLGVKGIKLSCVYALPGMEDIDLLTNHSTKKTTINFLVGNSANPSNQHLRVLKDLEFLKNENIKIILPLSYSVPDEYYVDSIIDFGKEIFGDKLVPITEYITPKDYYEILNNVDVAFFNSNRQQALGNIYVLLFLGTKIYLNEESGLVEKFKEMKAKVFSYKSINNLSFDQIYYLSQQDKKNNKRVSRLLLDRKQITKQWESVIERMKE